MNRCFFISCCLLGIFALGGPSQLTAQDVLQPSKLAPGILTIAPPRPEEAETFIGPLRLRELQTKDFVPNYAPKSDTIFERAKSVTLRHPVWTLEFSFKPLRMIVAEVPDHKSRKLKRKVVWYMVYRIRNTGQDLAPKPEGDPTDENSPVTFSVEPTPGLTATPEFIPNWFCPIVVMEAWVQHPTTNEYGKIEYVDRVLPTVVPQIQDKEDPAIPLLNSVQISKQIGIPVSDENNEHSLWGVLTWTDLDPRIDFASIYIGGLTNAFRMVEMPNGKAVYAYKNLQLNFWRPGDIEDEVVDKIRFGVPLVKDPFEQVRILDKFYSIPGPSITGLEFDAQNDKPTWLFSADGIVDPTLQSTVRRDLTAGTFPDSIRQEFAKAGIDLPAAITLTPKLDGSLWEFQANVDGVQRNFRLRYEPTYWEMTPDGLQIKERVDHLWVYR